MKFSDMMNQVEKWLFDIVKIEAKTVIELDFNNNLETIQKWLEKDHSDVTLICRSIHEMIKDKGLSNYARNSEKIEFCEFTSKVLMNYIVKVIFFVSVPFNIKSEFLSKFLQHCSKITDVSTTGPIINGVSGKLDQSIMQQQLVIFERLADINKHKFFINKFIEAYKERFREMCSNVLLINSYIPELCMGTKLETKNSKEARDLSFRFIEERSKKKK